MHLGILSDSSNPFGSQADAEPIATDCCCFPYPISHSPYISSEQQFLLHKSYAFLQNVSAPLPSHLAVQSP